ncbi:MAG: hypothetical protein ACI4O4_11620 [Candidatus Ventricola sp.]
MRSNRPSYASAPAGSSRALDQKPRPKRPKKEWNQLLLMLFFVVLPVFGLLAIFFQPFRWVFMILTVACLALMWFVHAFLFPGRMILTAAYGLLMVFTLVTALNAKSSSRLPQTASPFGQVTTTIAPTQVPIYSQGYDSTSGIVTDSGYDAISSIQEVGMAGGSEDQSTEDLGLTDAGASEYVPTVKSDAEIALENFMEKWRKGIIADMVAHTPPTWRNAQADSAQQQLFWKFAQKPLQDWRQMSAPTGTNESTARTISVEADISYSGEVRTYAYDAIALYEEGSWYIDPDSLSSGILKVPSTPTPDPNATPEPTPEPTPTPTPGPKTKLYYNKDGGKYYHADPECSSVAKEFLPLTSFTYGNLNKSPYTKLQPCPKCDAPSR